MQHMQDTHCGYGAGRQNVSSHFSRFCSSVSIVLYINVYVGLSASILLAMPSIPSP